MESIRLKRYEVERDYLPNVCMRCGAPAIERKRRRFKTHPPWVYILLPLGWVLYVIAAAVLTKEVRCHTPLCGIHKNHWRDRAWIVFGGFGGVVAPIVCSVVLASVLAEHVRKGAEVYVFGSVCVGSFVLILSWPIVVLFLQATAIHPVEITSKQFTLKGVSPEFVDAMYEYRIHRRRQEEADAAEEFEEAEEVEDERE